MMRRQRDICLLRRHLFKFDHPIPSLTRYTSASSREPYILPRLVIDLDANDSQFVREAKEEDYAVPDKPPRRQRYGPFAPEENSKEASQLNPKARRPFDLRAATAPDLLQYALLGNPYAFPKDNNADLRKVFNQYKVHSLDNADTKIKRLTYNFTTDSSKLLEGAGFTTERGPLVLEQIRDCVSFDELKRLVSIISSTVEGCKFLAANGADVVDGIMRCRKELGAEDRSNNRDATATNVLALLNNLRVNMRSKGVSLGSDLCNAALYYASSAFCLPSVRTYLSILIKNSYGPKRRAVWAMSQLAINQRRGPNFQSTRNRYMDIEERKREVLSLMTGWEFDGVPKHPEEPKPSFQSAVAARTYGLYRRLVYATYLAGLSHLGASDALWHEWRNGLPDGFSTSEAFLKQGVSHSVTAMDLRETVEVFSLAFLMADDPDRALHVLRTFFGRDIPSIFLDESAGDLESPTNVLCEQTWHELLWYYKSNNLVPTERLREHHCTEFFFDGPKAIFQKLNDMLVPEWIKSKELTDIPFKGRRIRYSIDWVEQDGVEGVTIKDVDQKIIYFKPPSRRPSSPETGV